MTIAPLFAGKTDGELLDEIVAKYRPQIMGELQQAQQKRAEEQSRLEQQEREAAANKPKRRRRRRGPRLDDVYRGKYVNAYPIKSDERDGDWRIMRSGESGRQLMQGISRGKAIEAAKKIDQYIAEIVSATPPAA